MSPAIHAILATACCGVCHAGDVVGALLNRTTKTISFIKNGIDLGVAFSNVQEERLFPSVGMRTPDEEVNAGLNACTCVLPLVVSSNLDHVGLADDPAFSSSQFACQYCALWLMTVAVTSYILVTQHRLCPHLYGANKCKLM